MAINNFDPTQYGATKFDPTQYGATRNIQGLSGQTPQTPQPYLTSTGEDIQAGLAKSLGEVQSSYKKIGEAPSLFGKAMAAEETGLKGIREAAKTFVDVPTKLVTGAIGDITPSFIKEPVKSLARGVGGIAANIPTDIAKAFKVPDPIAALKNWSENNPEQARTLSAIVDFGTLLLGGEGAKVAEETITPVVKSKLEGIAKRKATEDVWKKVQPELTKLPVYQGESDLTTKILEAQWTKEIQNGKFANSEEFVKAQGEVVYRGGGKYDPSKIGSDGIALTTDAERAKFFTAETQGKGGEKGRFVQDFVVDKNANIARQGDVPKDLWQSMEPDDIANWAKKNGYDGIDLRELGGSIAHADKEIRIFNPDILKTKSQLTDIWNKAIGKTTIGTILGGGTAVAEETITPVVKSKLEGIAKRKATEDVWKKVQPELTKLEQSKAVKSGKIVESGKLGTITQIPAARDREMIEAARPYVINSKNELESVANMKQGISESAVKVRKGLEQSPATWNEIELIKKISAIEEPITVKSNMTLHRTFENFTNAVINIASKADKKVVGILDARQALDTLIEEELAPGIYDKTNPLSKVMRSFRKTLNDFAESKIPEGMLPDGFSFKEELKKQSLLYDAIDNVAPKVPKLGSNKISQWIENNPAKASTLKWVAGLIGAEKGLKYLGAPLP